MFWAHAVSRRDDTPADGIHLLWAPPRWAGYSVNGFDIWRRRSRRPPSYECYDLTPGELSALHRVFRIETPPARLAFRRGPCPQPLTTIPDEPFEASRRRRRPPLGPAHQWLAAVQADERTRIAVEGLARDRTGLTPTLLTRARRPPVGAPSAPPGGGTIVTDAPSVAAPPIVPYGQCVVYTFGLTRPCYAVRLRLGVSFGLAVAFREEKPVDSGALVAAGHGAEIEFRREGIDRVIVWTGGLARSIQICWRAHGREDDDTWRRATLVARRLQVPFEAVHPGLADVRDEENLARARLLPGEELGPGGFKQLSTVMNAALRQAGASPVHVSRLVRETQEQSFFEIAPWAMGTALALDAPWRRALGFGFLDEARNLERGATYDYRIVGRFRRRDLEEHLLGFHTVPLGTPLPRSLRLGAVRLDLSGNAEIAVYPPPPTRALAHPCRKGLRLDGRVTISFAEPQTRVVLELEPGVASALTYRASSTDLIPGLPIVVDGGNVASVQRAELTFSQPVTRVELGGTGLLYGLRFPAVPPGADSDALVEVSAYVLGVVFEHTAPPEAPSVLGTENLQQPPGTGHPAVTTQHPPHFMGFRLNWLPPAASPTWPPGWWPPDLPARPPMDVVGFDLERRRIDTASGWVPFDRDPDGRLHTLVGSARSGRREPQTVRPGDDLLVHFPEIGVPAPPVPVLSEIDDVLHSPRTGAGPPPGSLWQYRIRSVDIIGRRSSVPTLGSVVRLEKRLAPPQPVGPPVAADEERPIIRGVRARVLQADDPNLSAVDAARLGGRANAVLLEWGWTAEERRADPWAREFRVYWQPNPPDLIRGEFTGPAVPAGTAFEIASALSHSVPADAFAGQFVPSGGYVFRIAGHGAGSMPVFRLEPSTLALTPTPVPGPGTFVLRAALNGDELQPAAWAERSHVEPIAAREAYEFLFPFTLAIDAAHPHPRVWVGVSAADHQGYRPDAIPAGRPNGGRPGNESSIVPAVAEAGWRGRPTFDVPPPLPDVPTVTLPEVGGDEVTHDIDVPGLVGPLPGPPAIRFLLERLSVADVVGLLAVDEADDIAIVLPDPSASGGISSTGSVRHPYAPANPADHAALVAAIRTGEPARIENRFLMDIAIRFNDTTLANFWRTTRPDPLPLGPMSDRVPNKAERYLYRLRWVDAAGRASPDVAFVPRVFRVPSLRTPAAPQIVSLAPSENEIRLTVRTGDRFDVAGILVFAHAEGTTARPDPEHLRKPQLLRTPNRPDLYAADGIRLRLGDGTLLVPTYEPLATASVAGSVRTWEVARVVGHGQTVAAWVVTVTRDGVPSAVAGPMTTVTPLAPPPVPALTMSAAPGEDQASWTPAGAGITYRLERSVDGGATWQPVSPWLPATATGHGVVPGAEGRLYRLRARRAGRREATGPAVEPA